MPEIRPSGKFTLRILVSTSLFFSQAQADIGSDQILPQIPQLKVSFPAEPDEFPLHLALQDSEDRLSPLWDIPEGLYLRTSFWLMIYSRLSSEYNVIHHKDFPWIIYGMADVTDLRNAPAKRWEKHRELQKRTDAKVKKIRQLLKGLGEVASRKKLSAEQQKLKKMLADVPGPRENVYRLAAEKIRVQLGQQDFFRAGLINSRRYLLSMEKIFAEHGLPIELTRLPLVESSFNENAVSKSGASGVWQIMPHVGKHYLRVTARIDERNSPLKATRAAAEILKENYVRLQAWPLAVTAYNHGPGGIARAVRQTHSEELHKIILNYQGRNFGFASQNFYSEFLAALYAEKYQDRFFGELPKPPAVAYEEVPLRSSLSTKQLTAFSRLSEEKLLQHNLDLGNVFKKDLSLPAKYTVILPEENAQLLKEKLSTLKVDQFVN